MSVADDLKLGKKRGVVKDARTIQFRDLLIEHLPVPPEQSYIGKSGSDREYLHMYGNDRYGDCTCVAHAHAIDLREYTARQEELQLDTEDVLQVYSAVTGFDASDPSTDNGAYMLDINNYMRRYGMGQQANGEPHKIGAFAEIDPKSPLEWRRASYLFGGVYWGVALPLTVADQIDAGKPYWRVDPTAGDRAEPGSWGGHAMHTTGYSEGSIVTASWGARYRVTWDFLAEYCDEAYAIISDDYLRADQKTREGFDLDALRNLLAEIADN